jgi:hypothetical protein
MSSSQSTNLNTQQVNNDTARNNVVKNITNSLERQKDTILKNEGIDNMWFKVNERVSVKLKEGIPVMESTFRLD